MTGARLVASDGTVLATDGEPVPDAHHRRLLTEAGMGYRLVLDDPA
ncbi:hypothetical protein [Microbacterium immunditiarum]|uniref:Uncharacterized protein n=1 Tax=Microbacterium immunditiarum TaxID=337480 RepID=A0A7Y9KIB6_9MICO|nr:hypothetical protein [Microbacterium immunditiarum]NYE18610.1 hypothetical protein [Microbacterium immunditiarum]